MTTAASPFHALFGGTFTLQRLRPSRSSDGGGRGASTERAASSSSHPTITVTYRRPLPHIILLLSTLFGFLSLRLYVTHPYARLGCTRHESRSTSSRVAFKNNNAVPQQNNEDNDCGIDRSVRSVRWLSSPSWRMIGGGNGRVEFQFEVDSVFVGVHHTGLVSAEGGDHNFLKKINRGNRADTQKKSVVEAQDEIQKKSVVEAQDEVYLDVRGDGTVRKIHDRRLGVIDKITHRHIVLLENGEISKSKKANEIKEEDAPKPLVELFQQYATCEMAILLTANNGRVYNYFEYECPNHRIRRSYPSISHYPAFQAATKIASYLERSARDPDHKHHLEVVQDQSSFHLLVLAALLTVAAVAISCPTAREKVVVDANAGTLAVSKKSMAIGNGLGDLTGFISGTGSHVCALENLVKARIVEVFVYKPSKRGAMRRNKQYQLQLQLAGLGAKSRITTNSYGSGTSSEYESVIEVGLPQVNDAKLRRICEAINDILLEFSGVVTGDGMGGHHHDNSTSSRGKYDSNTSTLTSKSAGGQRGVATGSNSPSSPRLRTASLVPPNSMCAICLVRRPSCVFFPCKHLRCCSHCSVRLDHCPICRAFITDKCTVFL